jgi:hypothetical protein
MTKHDLHYEIKYVDKLTNKNVRFKHLFESTDSSHDLARHIAGSIIERDKAHSVTIDLLFFDHKDIEHIRNTEHVKRKKDGKIVSLFKDTKNKKMVEVVIPS